MADTKQFTEENDILKQFMELLNQQNMGEQSQDFMELFKYAAGMQLQLAVMAEELQAARQQLQQLQEKPGVGLTRVINKPVKKAVENLRKIIASVDRAFEKLDRLSESFSVGKEAEKGGRESGNDRR